MYDAVRVPTAKNLSLPDVIMPNDVRNDLYVHIMNGKFSKLDKIGDRNVEMIMEVCDEDGKIVPDSICKTFPKSIFLEIIFTATYLILCSCVVQFYWKINAKIHEPKNN